MEVFGAAAGAATFVTLLRPTAKFVESLSTIASDSGVVAEEIRKISSQLQMSAASIDISLKALKGHCEALKRTKDTPSPVLQFIIKENLVDVIVSGTNKISKQMNDIVRDLKDAEERPKIIKKLKWCLWNKMEVESLFPEMQLVASSLTLVCPIIGLEIDRYLLKRTTGDAAQCIKQEMKSSRSQIKLCEQQHERIINEQSSNVSSDIGSDAEFKTLTESLLHLSKSVRRTGTAPASTSRRSSASQESSPRMHSRSATHVPNNNGDTEPPSEPFRLRSRESFAPREPPLIPAPQAGSSEVSREVPPTSTRKKLVKKPMSIMSTISQRTDATSNSRLLAMRAGHREGLRSAMGFVENPKDIGNESVVIVTIDSTSPDNYISINTAKKLGLDITELEPGHPPRVHNINGKSHGTIVGKASGVKWRHEGLLEPIILDLFVKKCVQDEGKHLILGRRFVREVERYGHNL